MSAIDDGSSAVNVAGNQIQEKPVQHPRSNRPPAPLPDFENYHVAIDDGMGDMPTAPTAASTRRTSEKQKACRTSIDDGYSKRNSVKLPGVSSNSTNEGQMAQQTKHSFRRELKYDIAYPSKVHFKGASKLSDIVIRDKEGNIHSPAPSQRDHKEDSKTAPDRRKSKRNAPNNAVAIDDGQFTPVTRKAQPQPATQKNDAGRVKVEGPIVDKLDTNDAGASTLDEVEIEPEPTEVIQTAKQGKKKKGKNKKAANADVGDQQQQTAIDVPEVVTEMPQAVHADEPVDNKKGKKKDKKKKGPKGADVAEDADTKAGDHDVTWKVEPDQPGAAEDNGNADIMFVGEGVWGAAIDEEQVDREPKPAIKPKTGRLKQGKSKTKASTPDWYIPPPDLSTVSSVKLSSTWDSRKSKDKSSPAGDVWGGLVEAKPDVKVSTTPNIIPDQDSDKVSSKVSSKRTASNVSAWSILLGGSAQSLKHSSVSSRGSLGEGVQPPPFMIRRERPSSTKDDQQDRKTSTAASKESAKQALADRQKSSYRRKESEDPSLMSTNMIVERDADLRRRLKKLDEPSHPESKDQHSSSHQRKESSSDNIWTPKFKTDVHPDESASQVLPNTSSTETWDFAYPNAKTKFHASAISSHLSGSRSVRSKAEGSSLLQGSRAARSSNEHQMSGAVQDSHVSSRHSPAPSEVKPSSWASRISGLSGRSDPIEAFPSPLGSRSASSTRSRRHDDERSHVSSHHSRSPARSEHSHRSERSHRSRNVVDDSWGGPVSVRASQVSAESSSRRTNSSIKPSQVRSAATLEDVKEDDVPSNLSRLSRNSNAASKTSRASRVSRASAGDGAAWGQESGWEGGKGERESVQDAVDDSWGAEEIKQENGGWGSAAGSESKKEGKKTGGW